MEKIRQCEVKIKMDPEPTKAYCKFCGRPLTDLNATAHKKCQKSVNAYNNGLSTVLTTTWPKSRLLGIIKQSDSATDMCWRQADEPENTIRELLAMWFDLDPDDHDENKKVQEVFYRYFYEHPAGVWILYLKENAVKPVLIGDIRMCRLALSSIQRNMENGAKSVLLSSLAKVALEDPSYTNLTTLAEFYAEHNDFIQEFKLQWFDIPPYIEHRHGYRVKIFRWIHSRF